MVKSLVVAFSIEIIEKSLQNLKPKLLPFLWPFLNFPFIFVYFKMINRGREQQADRLCEFKKGVEDRCQETEDQKHSDQ